MSASLARLSLADSGERWEALGFTVIDGVTQVGGVTLTFGGPGRGITGWTLRGIDATGDIDGLATATSEAPAISPKRVHPNGALAIDHVVVLTPDFERTGAALASAGLALRRIREAGSFRQGFRRLGPTILELVEARDAAPGPARFWGLVVTVPDLAAVARFTGAAKPAVQPGRHIATVRRECGLSLAVAFMDPEPR